MGNHNSLTLMMSVASAAAVVVNKYLYVFHHRRRRSKSYNRTNIICYLYHHHNAVPRVNVIDDKYYSRLMIESYRNVNYMTTMQQVDSY